MSMDRTPPHLRALEVEWRGNRKEVMEASLRRRVHSTPEDLRGQRCRQPTTASNPSAEPQRGVKTSVPKLLKSDAGRLSNIYLANPKIELERNKPSLQAGPTLNAVNKIQPQRLLRSSEPSHRSCELRDRTKEAPQSIEFGVLPPGRYHLARTGSALHDISVEYDYQRQERKIMLSDRARQVEILEQGSVCHIFHRVQGRAKPYRVLDVKQYNHWDIEDRRLWKAIAASLRRLQMATDRAVYNLAGGRLHISCSSPPELIFYVNSYVCHKNATSRKDACDERLDGSHLTLDAHPLRTKIVLDIRRSTCTILCAKNQSNQRKQGNEKEIFVSKRVLQVAKLAELEGKHRAQRQSGVCSSWNKSEIEALGRLLDSRSDWEGYWGT